MIVEMMIDELRIIKEDKVVQNIIYKTGLVFGIDVLRFVSFLVCTYQVVVLFTW